MGDKVLDKSMELRKAVSFQREYVDKLPSGCKFFHPLPRDARYPTLPFWLDSTELNGWDRQSQNGYFTRIVLLGMLNGQFGDDFVANEQELEKLARIGESSPPKEASGQSPLESHSDFIRELSVVEDDVPSRSREMGLVPISDGILIDGLAEGQSIDKIWGLMYMVRSILGLNRTGGQGVNRSRESPEKAGGFISVPDLDVNDWDVRSLKKLASMAPGSLVNMVRGGKIEKVYQLQVPPRIYNFPDISCKNKACVSHPLNMQHEVPPYFLRAKSRDTSIQGSDAPALAFVCKYCESIYDFWQIWDYKYYETLDELVPIPMASARTI
jgi:aspartate carbamoyltransferase